MKTKVKIRTKRNKVKKQDYDNKTLCMIDIVLYKCYCAACIGI